MRRYFSLLCILALLVGCYNTDEQLINEPIPSEGRIFTASFEQNDTRTYVEEGNLLRWNAGDQITIFDSYTLNQQYQFDGETGDNGGTFSKVSNQFGTGNDLNCHYAVYPYNKDIKITETGAITANLPAEQSYAENSFGLGANTMVAVTKDVDDTFLKFKNVGGYLKLQLYGDDVTVKSITLEGNSNEKIAGKSIIAPSYSEAPSISMADDAAEIITLNCGEGVEIGATSVEATAFWLVVPPTTFDEGFTVTVTDIDGGVFTQSTSKEIVIDRNVIHPMEAFKVEIKSIPNNQIWYTSTDGNVVTPYKTDVFGANITSNVYDGDKGIITFDNDVTTIGNDAFLDCKSLTGIIIPNRVISIGEYAFRQCTSLSDITIPNSVKSIALEAFSYCNSLFSITIPKSVTNMNRTIFDCSYNLSSIIIELGNPVYDSRENCNAIIETASNTLINGCKNTIIPNTVTSIGSYAFFGSFSLTNITIPNSVTSIGNHAFRNCTSLTSISIPNSVTNIGVGAFANCSSLTSIVVDSSNPVYDSRKNCNAIIETASNTLISGCNSTVIPNTVTTIGSDAFVCKTLTSITIPNSVTSISNSGFYFCSSLTDITIPSSVTSIGDFAFSYCSSLTRLNVKSTTPPTLGGGVFSNGNTNLKIYVPAGSLEAYKAADNWKDLDLLSDETIPNNQIWYITEQGNTVTPYKADAFGVNIISNVYKNGKGIITFDGALTSIGEYAFKNCNNMVSITLPNSVTSIGKYAFETCSVSEIYIKATTPPIIYDTSFNIYFSLNFYVPAESVEAYKKAGYGRSGWSLSADDE